MFGFSIHPGKEAEGGRWKLSGAVVSHCLLKTLGGISALLFLFASCDESIRSSVPDTVVNFTCSLQQAPYSFITTPGQFLSVTKDGSSYAVQIPGQPLYRDGKTGVYLGFGGLIIGYPAISMEVSSQYAAYDLACPVEAEDLTISRLAINQNREGKCGKCGTVYDLDTGFPKIGVGKERLKTYKVYADKTALGTTLVVKN